MNTDIRISVSFMGHRKRRKLRLVLGENSTDYLIDLWISTAMNHPTGRLNGMDEIDIALASGWDKDPALFVAGLMRCGFLDRYEDGTYALHDWEEHQGYAVHAEARSAKGRNAAEKRWNARNNATSIEKHAPSNAPSMNSDAPIPDPIPDPDPSPKEEKTVSQNISAQAPDTQTATPSAPRTEPATTATATEPTTTSKASQPTAEFEAFWREYPQRAGGNPKNKAVKSWNALRKEGHSADEILAGTRRYAAYCQATGKVGGEYVKQACTFLGPDKFFTEAWDLPTPKPATPGNGPRYPSSDPHEKHARLVTGNQSAIEEWLNRDTRASPFIVTVISNPVPELTHANH